MRAGKILLQLAAATTLAVTAQSDTFPERPEELEPGFGEERETFNVEAFEVDPGARAPHPPRETPPESMIPGGTDSRLEIDSGNAFSSGDPLVGESETPAALSPPTASAELNEGLEDFPDPAEALIPNARDPFDFSEYETTASDAEPDVSERSSRDREPAGLPEADDERESMQGVILK